MRPIHRSILLAAAASLLFACGGNSPPRPPAPGGRTITFPADISLGELFTRDWASLDPEAWEPMDAEAQGEVRVEAGRALQLRVSAARSPEQQSVAFEALAELAPEALHAISVQARGLSRAEMEVIARQSHLEELSLRGEFEPRLLELLGELRWLKTLIVQNTDLRIGGNLRYVAELKGLRRFSINQDLTMDFSDGGSEHLAGMKELRALRMDNFRQNATAGERLLRDLGRLEKLEELDLSISDLHAAKLASLGRLRGLRILRLRINMDASAPSPIIDDDALAFLGKLDRLEELYIEADKGVTDVTLRLVLQHERLKSVGIVGSGIELTSLTQDDPLERLETLNLSGAEIGDAGAVQLARARNLRELNLGRTPITDGVFATLARLPELRSLNLYGDSGIRGEGIAALGALAHLETLNLRHTAIDDAALETIARFPALRSLSVNSPNLKGATLEALLDTPKLESLYMDNAEMDVEGIAALRELSERVRVNVSPKEFRNEWMAWPEIGLRALMFSRSPASALTDEGIALIPPDAKVRLLSLENTGITDAGLEHLARVPSITQLIITGTRTTSEGLRALKDLPNLRSLWIGGPEFSWRGAGGIGELKGLKQMSVIGTTLAPEALRAIGSLEKMEDILLKEVELEGGDLSGLAGLRALTQFRVWATTLTMQSLTVLPELIGLKQLELVETGIDDVGLRPLGDMKGLESLVVDSPAVTDIGLGWIARIESLQRLELRNAAISDAGLASLARLENLLELEIILRAGASVHPSAQAFDALRRAMPGTRIEYRLPAALSTPTPRRPIG